MNGRKHKKVATVFLHIRPAGITYHFMSPSNAGFIRKHYISPMYIKLLDLRVSVEEGAYIRKYSK